MARSKKKDGPKRSSGGGRASDKRSRKKRGPSPVAGFAIAEGEGKTRPPAEKPALAMLPQPADWPATTWAVLGGFFLVFVYSYWPTIAWMSDLWYREPDYNHGWFVPFLALSICWHRAHLFPGVESKVSWNGISLILIAILMRIAGRFAYADFLDAWSMLPLICGVVWCLLGARALWWALPAIGFLVFAMPLPYQAESMLSWRLQGVATELSKFGLRVLGQPAVSEGHVIWIGQEPLIVEQACSGLRIFVGMGAFAVYWAAINDRSWADRIFLLAVAIPAAIFVNAMRIILIGLLYPFFSGTEIRHWIHEISGIIMLFASFALMGLASLYWKNLYRREERVTARETLRDSSTLSARSRSKGLGHSGGPG